MTEHTITEQEIKEDVHWALRELTSNLMRVTRGAGKPYDILMQLNRVAETFNNHKVIIGHFPSGDSITVSLNIFENAADEIANARQTVVSGALQIAASRLVGQKTQETAGESELSKGIFAIENYRHENRKRVLNYTD